MLFYRASYWRFSYWFTYVCRCTNYYSFWHRLDGIGCKISFSSRVAWQMLGISCFPGRLGFTSLWIIGPPAGFLCWNVNAHGAVLEEGINLQPIWLCLEFLLPSSGCSSLLLLIPCIFSCSNFVSLIISILVTNPRGLLCHKVALSLVTFIIYTSPHKHML